MPFQLPRAVVASLLASLAIAGCASPVADDAVESDESEWNAESNSLVDEGALAVAFAASLDFLKRPIAQNGAGVPTSAAQSIVAFRLGADGVPGTADDRPIRTIADLDAIPRVGPVTIRRLRDVAQKTRIAVDGNPTMSLAQLGDLVNGRWSLVGYCHDNYTATIVGNHGVGGGGGQKTNAYSFRTPLTVTLEARRTSEADDVAFLSFDEAKGFTANWFSYQLVATRFEGGGKHMPSTPASFDVPMVMGFGASGAHGWGGQELRIDKQNPLSIVYTMTQSYTETPSSWATIDGDVSCEARSRL